MNELNGMSSHCLRMGVLQKEEDASEYLAAEPAVAYQPLLGGSNISVNENCKPSEKLGDSSNGSLGLQG